LQISNMKQINACGGLAIMVNEGNIESLLTLVKEIE